MLKKHQQMLCMGTDRANIQHNSTCTTKLLRVLGFSVTWPPITVLTPPSEQITIKTVTKRPADLLTRLTGARTPTSNQIRIPSTNAPSKALFCSPSKKHKKTLKKKPSQMILTPFLSLWDLSEISFFWKTFKKIRFYALNDLKYINTAVSVGDDQ